MDASLVVFCLEYTWINRVAPTHDLNAILFPPNSESTVRCIAVYAISRLSVHYTGYLNKFMHLYCNYFEHTRITHIYNHLKEFIKFNYLQYNNLKIQSRLLLSSSCKCMLRIITFGLFIFPSSSTAFSNK